MQTQIGTFLSTGSPAVAELAGMLGFDWVLIDLEHGAGTEGEARDQLRALSASATKAIVRVGAPHTDLIARLLDWGAHGIMAPHVNSAAEAEALVQAAHYAPVGRRGYSRTVRAHGYGLRTPEEGARPIIMAQIESVEGVQNAEKIAQVDGVNVLFVGPADLEFDLRNHGSAAAWGFEQCLDLVSAAAAKAGKEAGLLVREPTKTAHYIARGFRCIAIDSDFAILRKAWTGVLASLR